MSVAQLLVLTGVVIHMWGGSYYIRDTIRGTTQPHLITWCMWAIAPLIGFGAAISAGASIWALVPVFLAGFFPLLVVVAAIFFAKSLWRVTAFDILCGSASFIALGLWLLAEQPQLAILFAATGDLCAAIPTIRKAVKFPESESVIAYCTGLLGVLLAIPSVPSWSIENFGFQSYLIVVNLLLIFAVFRKRIALRFGMAQ